MFSWTANKTVYIHNISYVWKGSLKTSVKTKMKNPIKFFEKVVLKPLKPYSIPLKVLMCSILDHFERQ